MKILIVDDLALNRKVLRAILASAGHEVAEANDGEGALEALKFAKFDAVVTDVLMPRMDGYRLCHEIRRREELAPIAIVVYTSTYTSPADEDVAMRVGADLFLRKPSPPQVILDAIASAVASPRAFSASEPLGDLATVREYSEALVRKLEEKNKELESSERSLKDFVELSPIGICRSTPEGKILSGNRALATLLGYSGTEDLYALNLASDIYFDRADRAIALARFGKGEREFECRWKKKDGSPVWVEIDGRIAFDEAGRPRFYESFVRNITGRKTAEAEADRSMTEAAGRRRRSALVDLLAMFALTALAAWLANRYDGFGVITEWLRAHEPTPIDEILVSLIVLSFLGGVFSYRRWREMRSEMFKRERTERALRELRADLENQVQARTAALETSHRELTREIEIRRLAQEAASKLELAVEQSGNVVFMTDADGRLTYTNPAFSQTYGYTSDEVLGRNPRIIKSGLHDRAFYEHFWGAMHSGSGFRGEMINRARDGRLVTVDTSANAIFDARGSRIGFVAVQNDITERIRAGEVARKSKLRVAALMDNAIDAIFVNSPDGVVVDCNKAADRLLGRPRSEIIGLSVSECVAPEERGKVGRAVTATLSEGSVTGLETLSMRADGTRVPVEVSASVVDVEGERLILAILRDVSERKLLEEQFRQAQKMEAIGRLAGGIAHDFNNLLMVVQGIADVLPLHAGNEAAMKNDLANLRRASQRGGALTRQLLAFSRQHVLQTEVLDVGGVIRDLSPMIGRLLGEDVELAVGIAPESGTVDMDRSQLEQIVMNLAVNARDAMPSGGRLSIDVAPDVLDEAYASLHAGVNPGRYVRISVSDSGVGMTPEVQKRIFEPFFTTKEEGRGTGLGLATVYGIVNNLGGNVWAYGEPGRGSVFKIYLPRAEGALNAARRSTPENAVAVRGNETIVIVEDEETIRQMAITFLEGIGYRVLSAANGTDAVELLKREAGKIDVLVTDVVLPGCSGHEVAEAAGARDSKTRIIFMSGYTDDAAIRRDVAAKDFDFLQKPFPLQVLAEKIRTAIDRPPSPGSA